MNSYNNGLKHQDSDGVAAMPKQRTARVDETHVDVVETPPGVLNVIIRDGRPADPLEILRRSARRAPKRAHDRHL